MNNVPLDEHLVTNHSGLTMLCIFILYWYCSNLMFNLLMTLVCEFIELNRQPAGR